jgi:3'(2'), 5'-bisphosphate nucleotidase
MSGLDRELAVATDLARRAGRLLRADYAPATLTVDRKAYGEPVTEADRAASRLVLSGLAAAFPDDARLSEEDADLTAPLARGRCWVIDPLDGTQEFVDGRDDWVVMIGLLVDAAPVLGVVYHPALDQTYRGGPDLGLERLDRGAAHGTALRMPAPPADLARLRMVASRSHRSARLEAAKAALGIIEDTPCGSVGLKVTRLASGDFDLYVHPSSGLKVWDTCAPEALVLAAGGRVTDLHGDPLGYAGNVLHGRGLIAAHADVIAPVIARLAGLRSPG